MPTRGGTPATEGMKVLFIDQYAELGGAQLCLLDLLPAVVDAGWDAHVAIPGDGPLAERLASLDVALHSIPTTRLSAGQKSWRDVLNFTRHLPRLAAAIAGIVSRCDADLVYVNGPRVLPAASLAVNRAVGKGIARQSPALLFHSHNHLRQRADRWIAARAIRHCDATVVGCCRFSLEPLTRQVRPERSYVVYNGTAPPVSIERPRLEKTGPTIGVIGRLGHDKGQKEFLLAARRISRVRPDCRFLICGDVLFGDQQAIQYRDSLRTLAEGLPVEFLGWRRDVASVMSALDLLVVPSIWEPGAPRVILESYASGVPVVAFPAGGIPEILHDGETGFLAQPSTPAALAEKILEVVSHESTLAAAALGGHELWKSRFTVERYRQEMLAIMAGTVASGEEPQQSSEGAVESGSDRAPKAGATLA